MNLKKPQMLKPGDRVATITLSWGGAGVLPHRYLAGKKQLEEGFGVEVVETKHALCDEKWIAQNPNARADDLMEAFSDPSIKAIISIIGGDDSIRMAPYVDLSVIERNPKIFMGYSDTTVTHFLCLKAGLSSFYGPSIMAGFAENAGLFPYMVDAVKRTLFSTQEIGIVHPNKNGWTGTYLNWDIPENQAIPRDLIPPAGPLVRQGKGIVRGPLIGGCIEVLEMMKGTSIWPAAEVWNGAVLFIETSEELPPVYYFRRWIRSYASLGILEKLSAIILGRPGGKVTSVTLNMYDDVLIEVVRDECGLADLPIVVQMDFGHTDPMFVIPYGQIAEIDCDNNIFKMNGSAVIERD